MLEFFTQNPSIIIAGVSILGIVILILAIFSFIKRYYVRTSADEALIRTGSGGKSVVIDRGIWVFGILHELAKVSLRTVRLAIRREGRHDSLITKDNIRVNIVVEFYLKVQPDEESVLNAARSLGNRNVDEKSISELMEGKLTDVLRSVAANKEFLELHQGRQEFAQEILDGLNAVIHKNGFTLESVSITNLNQTPLADLDERDYFDSQGARTVVETVEKARQERNQIELESQTKIQEKNFIEEQKVLAIKEKQSKAQQETQRRIAEIQKTEEATKQKRLFEIEQQLQEEKKLKEVETHKKINETEQSLAQDLKLKEAETRKKVNETELILAEEVARKKAETDQAILLHRQATESAEFDKYAIVQRKREEAERAAKVAEIERQKALEAAEIERQKTIEAAQIAKEREIATARLEKEKSIETGEVLKQRAVDTALIETEKTVETAKVDKMRAIEQANLEKEVAIIQTLEQKAEADAKRLAAIALKEEAEQKVLTVQETAAADRQRGVTVIRAEEQARRETIDAEAQARKETIDAEAKAKVVLERARSEAEAQRLEAEAKANYQTISAKGQADAQRLDAEARANYEVILAKGQADAVRVKAEADAEASGMQAQAIRDLALANLEKGKSEAEAKRLSIAAENAVSNALLAQRTAEQLVAQLPAMVHEFMRPAEAIKEIKILQVNGPQGHMQGGNGEAQDGQNAPMFGAMSPVIKALIEAGAAYPIVKELFGFAQKSEVVQKLSAQLPAEINNRLKEILPASDASPKEPPAKPDAQPTPAE